MLNPNGSKLWRLSYRFGGKQKTLALGAYPAVSLAAARKRRDEAKMLLATGTDPGTAAKEERAAKLAVAENTFRAIANELLAKNQKEGKAETTINKKRWLLDMAFADLGGRPITEITAKEILDCIRKVEAVGNLETARRMRGTIGQVFRYAIATARADTDPTAGLRGALTAPTVNHHAAVTTSDQFGALIRACGLMRRCRKRESPCNLWHFSTRVRENCDRPNGLSSILTREHGRYQPAA